MAGNSGSILVDALIGAAAGAAAVWVMDRVDWFNFRHENPEARRRTQAARPNRAAPAQVLASKTAEALGYQVRPKDDSAAGRVVHYSIGIMPGALYGALRHTAPALAAGRGSLFGLGLFLLQDEGLNAVAGLSAKPSEYPWQAHARGFVAHLIYGLVLDSVLRTADSLRGPR
jgi:uncharacterized membrane protein YagU involved in acid resistance